MSLALTSRRPMGMPLVLRWGAPDEPVPWRPIRAPVRLAGLPPPADVPAWLPTGNTQGWFDFSGHVQRLCADIVSRCEFFHHIDVSRILFGITQARNGRRHGLQARVTPLRFRDGQLLRHHRRGSLQVQRYFVHGREILYLMTFCLPRFLNQDFEGKFVTLFHELYHISPSFDGDLRRHHGRYCIHSHSQSAYDQRMAALARQYLAAGVDPVLHAFLRFTFAQLHRRHGAVAGYVVPRPKLIPLSP